MISDVNCYYDTVSEKLKSERLQMERTQAELRDAIEHEFTGIQLSSDIWSNGTIRLL